MLRLMVFGQNTTDPSMSRQSSTCLVTLDGNETRTMQYSVIGMLCHSCNHQHGHFYAVFTYRGLSWIVDDGSFPRAIPKDQDRMKSQIVTKLLLTSGEVATDFPTGKTLMEENHEPAKTEV